MPAPLTVPPVSIADFTYSKVTIRPSGKRRLLATTGDITTSRRCRVLTWRLMYFCHPLHFLLLRQVILPFRSSVQHCRGETEPLSVFWQLSLRSVLDLLLWGQVGFSSTSSVTSWGSLIEGRSDQFMWIINNEMPSAPGALSSRQTIKPNSILKEGVLW